MNIFEGGRRLAKICYAIITIIGALVLLGGSPYLNKYYRIQDKPGLLPVDSCIDRTWFEAKVEGRPEWATVSICGFSDGPKVIDLNESDLAEFDQAIYSARSEYYGRAVIGTVVAILGAALLFWCIGWTIRGFLGIPRGHDQRVITPSSE